MWDFSPSGARVGCMLLPLPWFLSVFCRRAVAVVAAVAAVAMEVEGQYRARTASQLLATTNQSTGPSRYLCKSIAHEIEPTIGFAVSPDKIVPDRYLVSTRAAP